MRSWPLAKNTHSWAGMFMVLAALLCAWQPAYAYSVEAGDQIVRIAAGGAFSFVRHSVVTRATPPGVLSIQAEYDYALTRDLSLVAAIRPGFADHFVEIPLAAGARYRFFGLDAPLIPYASLQAVVALGLPIGPPPPHLNLSARLAAGLEYFVTGNFGVGVEFGLASGPLLVPAFDLESRTELLVSCGYRL